ncbi:unnamed protein product (macronuclear) [Paramecium tetraurelia]|uniref:Uncharacterized protein n=1 Tax=Paramecium tetraurelia TaxID=5888 RepID=A0BQL6_PARTE|nr:uncharacterized protein GSPATT00031062001 [Paramecium tetraurelia]CAK60833.1 unnamed protein product [Paramecium tetraurelia]|eukprot:XP_001428231.1 hypothetical protein (macronuclear) [Paramecium tetraurelia strain d4-2]
MNKDEENGHSSLNNTLENSQNYAYLLQQDYYEKFKMGQNLYEQSASLSRVSLGEKTSEDNNNTYTYINMIHLQERLSDQMVKNQFLENKIEQLSKELAGALNHVSLLQKQNELQSGLLKDANVKLQKKNKEIEIEKTTNLQLKRKISNLQQINTNYLDQVETLSLKKESVILSNYKTASEFRTSNQSNNSSQRKLNSDKIHQGLTEDSTVKDSSCSEQKSHDLIRFSESVQQFYKSSNLLSPVQQVSPKAQSNDLESRIDSTLAQIRAIRVQIQQLNKK